MKLKGGKRCLECFKIRLSATALFTSENGYKLFATTLATSRWKDLNQINKAGEETANLYPGVAFWANNWRKNGLAEKQAIIVKEYDFLSATILWLRIQFALFK